MFIKSLYLGVCMTNCYIVSGDNQSCIVIDPASDAEIICNEIAKYNFKLSAIFLTHGHFDHIYAIPELINKFPNAKIYLHKDEEKYLKDTSLNLSPMFGENFVYTGKVTCVTDGDILSECGLKFKVMHTPGHTEGSVCYITEDSIFSGDTLFASTVGRTDFPLGSFPTLLSSLNKLKALEKDYNIYPGHNAATTLNSEKKFNEYLQIK